MTEMEEDVLARLKRLNSETKKEESEDALSCVGSVDTQEYDDYMEKVYEYLAKTAGGLREYLGQKVPDIDCYDANDIKIQAKTEFSSYRICILLNDEPLIMIESKNFGHDTFVDIHPTDEKAAWLKCDKSDCLTVNKVVSDIVTNYAQIHHLSK